MEYRNSKTGRVVQRANRDEWLDRSKVWELVEPDAETEAEPQNDERTTD